MTVKLPGLEPLGVRLRSAASRTTSRTAAGVDAPKPKRIIKTAMASGQLSLEQKQSALRPQEVILRHLRLAPLIVKRKGGWEGRDRNCWSVLGIARKAAEDSRTPKPDRK